MKILITGATGFIGSKLTKLLLEKEYTIHYLTTSKNKVVDKPNYKGFYWNIETGEIDIKCFEGVEAIIHLSGATIAKRWTKAYKKELIDSRVVTTNLLFNAVKENNFPIKHIISASGTAIYPESYDRVYTEESTEESNDFLSTVVKQWEQSINKFKDISIKVSKIRTGVVFAKNGGAFPEMIKPIKYGLGSTMGNGSQIQSWIHIDDLTRIYCFILENNLEGIYNAVAPNSITNKNLTYLVAKKLNKPLFLPNIPQFFMKLVLGEMSFLLFTSKNLSSKKIQDLGYKFKYPDFQVTLQNLLQ